MLKSEIADAAGVSYRTFQRWYSSNHKRIENELGIKISIRKKLIPPKVVKWISENYCVDLKP